MFAKASDILVNAVRGIPPPEPLQIDSNIHVWNGKSLLQPLSVPKSQDIGNYLEDTSGLVNFVPKWLYDALMESDILVIDQSSYHNLADEVRNELEIIL
jgi:hypothetical protein